MTDEDPEVRRVFFHGIEEQSFGQVSIIDANKLSDWLKLLCITDYVLRAKFNWRQLVKKEPSNTLPLSLSELKEA